MNTQVQNRNQINDALLNAMEALQELEGILDSSERNHSTQADAEIGVALETLEVSHLGRSIDAIQNTLNVTLMQQ